MINLKWAAVAQRMRNDWRNAHPCDLAVGYDDIMGRGHRVMPDGGHECGDEMSGEIRGAR